MNICTLVIELLLRVTVKGFIRKGFFFWPGPLELIHILIIFKKILKYIFQGKYFFLHK